MPRNVDGEIIVGIDIPASTKIVESDIKKLLQNLTTLEAKINHADLTDNAKQELRKQINDIKNLTANVEHLALDDTAKQEFRNAVGKVNNLTANIQNVKLDPSFQANLQTALNGLTGLTININGVNINPSAVNNAGQQAGKLLSDAVENAMNELSSKEIHTKFDIDPNISDDFQTAIEDEIKKLQSSGKNVVRVSYDTDTTTEKTKNGQLKAIETLKRATFKYITDTGEVIRKTMEYKPFGDEENPTKAWVQGATTYTKSIEQASGATDKFIEKQKKATAKMSNVLESVKADFENQDRTRPITEQTHLDDLRKKATEVETAIGKMSTSGKSDFVDLQIEAQKLQNELNILIREYRDAENASNKMKGVKTQSGIEIATANFDKLKTQAREVNLDVTKLGDAFNNMIMHQGTDKAKQYLDAFNDQLRVSQAELETTNTKLKLFNALRKNTEDRKERQRIDDERTINSLLDKQISSYRQIQNINKQIAKETDSGVISALNDKKKIYQRDYLNAQKELSAYQYSNPEAYNQALDKRRQTQERILQNIRTEDNIVQQRNRAEAESRKIVEDREKYHKKLNTAKKEELALAKQLITADGKQREIARSNYNKRVSRVKYNKNELTKRNLWQGSQEFDFNSLSIDGANEVNRLMAKEIDKLISSLDKLEREYKESGASVDVFEAQMQSAKKTLSEITLNTKDVGKNLSSIGKVRDILSGVSSGRSNIDSVLAKRTDAYKQILTLNGQIARLDKVKDSEHIAKLQEERRIQQDIYDSATQELNVLSRSLQTMEERNRLAKLSSEYIAKAYNDVAMDFRNKDQQQANKDVESYVKKREQNESKINTELAKQKSALNEIILLENKIKNLDPSKESEQIANLKNQKKEQQAIYDASKERMSILAKEIYSEQEVAELKERQTREMREQNAISRQSVSAINEKDFNKAEDNKKSQRIKEANDLYSKQTQKLNEILSLEKKIETNELKGNANKLKPELSRKAVLEEEYKSLSKQLDKYSDVVDRQKQCSLHEERRRKNESEVLEILGRELDTLEKVEAKEQERLAKKAQSDHDAKQAMYEKLWFDYDNGNLNKVKTIDDNVANNTYATQINDLITKYKQYGLTVDQAEDKVRELRSALATMSNSDKSAEERIKAEERYQQALKKSQNEARVYAQNQRGLATDQQRLALANTMEAFLQKNTRITAKARQETEMYIATLRNLNSEMTVVAKNEINNSFKQMQNNMRVLGKLGYALKDQMKQATGSFVQWFSVSNLIMSGIYHGRSAITELKEIDTYLTEISKANNELTKSELADIGNRSFDIASNYGKTATDFLSAVQEASRAGYKNAEGIAELSTAAQGAGDMTSDVANQMLIATDKAYKMNGAVDLLRNTLDGMNFITNNNAVNMTELSEGMTIVASTAASFGVGVNELTAALGTMSATTQQSGSEVARAFRAILLNIRQVSDEEEGIDAEGLTKYERACNALGVKLKETKDGVLSLRDPMEVLKELSEEYVKLDESDIRRTNLLNSVGGKLRATQLDALLRQWSMYEKMLGEYEAGIGSMAVEAEKTANSWEGSLNRLSNTFADTIGNIANSDGVITLINSLNELLQVVNKLTDSLGSFGSIGMIGSAILGGKGLG